MRSARTAALGLLILAAGGIMRVGHADEIRPAVVFNVGGKHDQSFNESVAVGLARFEADAGITFVEVEPRDESEFEPAHRRLAERGQDPIIAVGYNQAETIARIAAAFPRTRFTLIDAAIPLPNVQSVIFKEHEGSFLVGVLAAMASKTGKSGFVGGMDTPIIRKFACGYVQGIKHANPRAEILQDMTGTTPAAWNNPARGAALALAQFERGVDVVYAAAGGTGIGVLRAAKQRGKLAIGVDSNQNGVEPGTVLTSMIKRVDLVAYDSLQAALTGRWRGGVIEFGLKEGGVDWVLDDDNAALITTAMQTAADAARADIIAGKIVVQDYTVIGGCPF
ncbi:MAG: BMP family ABC transporter substrate-binding protein [Alphaproteobacteria bacterium]|nr:BMP family ABC transporter substrate-binding protein [Alphaproteobacteria bacterium]